MFIKILKLSPLGLLIGAVLFFNGSEGQTQEQLANEIMIKVQPNIIALPGNNLSKVPIKYARVRSTDLRDLNEIYNASTIEKVFEIRKVGNRPPEKVEVADTYIIRFALDKETNILEVVSDYKALPVVLDAKEIMKEQAED